MPVTLERPKTITKVDFISALRSGEYPQLKDGRMADGLGAYCAMGVFQKVFDEFDAPIGARRIGRVPVAVFNRIAELNDGGTSFAALADLLEVHLAPDFSSLSC